MNPYRPVGSHLPRSIHGLKSSLLHLNFNLFSDRFLVLVINFCSLSVHSFDYWFESPYNRRLSYLVDFESPFYCGFYSVFCLTTLSFSFCCSFNQPLTNFSDTFCHSYRLWTRITIKFGLVNENYKWRSDTPSMLMLEVTFLFWFVSLI